MLSSLARLQVQCALSWCTERVEQAAWGCGKCWWHCSHNINMLWAAPGSHAHLAAHRSHTVGKHGFEFRVRCLYSRRGRTGGTHAQTALCVERCPRMALGSMCLLVFWPLLMQHHLQNFLVKDGSSQSSSTQFSLNYEI